MLEDVENAVGAGVKRCCQHAGAPLSWPNNPNDAFRVL
jgi:hypothetical protein